MSNVQEIISKLGLHPFPDENEGYFVRTFTSARVVPDMENKNQNSICTSVLYMPIPGKFLKLRKIQSEETLNWYTGGKVSLILIDPEGNLHEKIMGPDILAGDNPQCVIPAGWYQSSKLIEGDYALMGATVYPGFTYDQVIRPEKSIFEVFPHLKGKIEDRMQ